MYMNKKCTLLAAAALIVAGVFTANAQGSVPPAEWTAGNYYYLQDGSNYLALSGDKADSVIVKTIDLATATKASIDSALWQITNAGTTIGGTAYQFTNKATQAVLSFAASADAVPNLAAGIDKWLFTDGGAIKASYGNNQLMALYVNGSDLELSSASTSNFTVALPPASLKLNAEELGNGFSVFQLMFDGTYGGNIFAGQEILAKNLTAADEGYMTLQLQNDQSFPDGTPKYFGVDTTKTVIAGATGVFGANFALDSTYAQSSLHTVGNADFQKFKFTINLKNDSLAMFVKDAPTVNASPIGILGDSARVVYASVGSTKVLTVANLVATTPAPAQGTAPMITVKRGTPSTIPTGTGVYYLKSAGLNTAGEYWVSTSASVPMMSADSLSAFQAKGQWYVLENNGKYSVGSRYDGTDFGMNKEIFPVQGMANTYTISGRTDSITFVYQKDINFDDKFLGVRHFTVSEIADNGYQLSAVAGLGVGNLPVFAADSMLRAKAGSSETPIAFKVAIVQDSIPNVGENTGATSLGDKLYTATYKLAQQFTNDSVANNVEPDNTGLVLTSTAGKALTFTFVTALEGGKYKLTTGADFVSLDINNANLILSDKVAYFDFTAVDAPEYASFGNNHKQIGTNGKYLTMNPLNFYAEVKNEGQEILKADYSADNFSLWVEKADTVIPGKSLYYVSSALHAPETATADAATRYYLVSLRDSNKTFVNNNVTYYRAGFITSDTIKTMADSPALFAFKTASDGGYLLENQKELNRTLSGGNDFHTPYVGVVNNVVVMSNVGAPFTVDNTSAPTGNEDVAVSEIVITGGTDNVTIYNATGKKVTLTNILGQVIATVTATSDNFTLPAGKGIVVVSVEGGNAQKVIVR